MRVDIGCRGKVAVTKPFLNLLHRHTVRQQHARAAVTQIMETNGSKSIASQQIAETGRHIIRINQATHLINANVSKIVLAIATSGQSAIFFLLSPQSYAVKMDMIPTNPADKVERPRKEAFQAGFYDKDEINALFAASKGTNLEIPIMLAAFYGPRRSEAVGLKWDCVDFERNTITIRHTVTCFTMDGKRQMVASDTTKTKSSMRTLPLVPAISERLILECLMDDRVIMNDSRGLQSF